MSEPTIQQRRARDAWLAIQDEVKGRGFAGEYASLAQSAPADIQTSGLGQTVAFWQAKRARDGHKLLLRHVSKWVLSRMGEEPQDSMMVWITEVGSDEYLRATMEALEYLVWIKRFAEAELGHA